MLDEDNKWYCNSCKDHVQAEKSLEIYKIPRIMIISLKRFKTSKARYGMGRASTKVDTMVEFPLQGLDMSQFVLSGEQKKSTNLIYDCFAVSNHFGNVGFGHYTAYAENPITKKWYDFDDSHCGEINPDRIVTTAAYNLFFRRRDET